MNQQTYFGFNSIKNLRRILESENSKNIFLVTGRNSYETSGAKTALEPVLSKYQTTKFSDFSPSPKIQEIEKGFVLFEKNKYDIIIAVGGGSAIDTAKAIKMFYYNKTARNLPLVAIPTTSGSGSEATHFIVYYKTKEKQSGGKLSITLPNYAILDPKLTFSLPRKITASTGMDALSQAIESYWSINSTENSKKYSRSSIRLIINNLEKAANSPDEESREKMMKAANLSGKAINITKTTLPHALSYFLTSHFNIPHGHAAALTLGTIFQYNSETKDNDCNDDRGAKYVRENISDLCSILGVSNATQSKNIITQLMIKIGLKTSLRDLGIGKNELERIAKSVNLERLKNNPRKISFENLMEILRKL